MSVPPPKKKGKATYVLPDVESKLVDFCIALRSFNVPIFKEELIAYCNNLIQGTKLVSLFKHGEFRDSWYSNWLRRYHERLGTAAAKPLEVDRERLTTSKNVGKHYQILKQTFVDLGLFSRTLVSRQMRLLVSLSSSILGLWVELVHSMNPNSN